MSLNVITIREKVINLLKKNNLVGQTYDISDNLQNRVFEVKGGEPEYGTLNTIVPVVFVNITDYTEEISALGCGAHRSVEFNVNIYPITQFGAGHDSGGKLKAEDECQLLTQNIQDLIRAKPTWSVPTLWISTMETTKNDVDDETRTFVVSNRIQVLTKTLHASGSTLP